MKNLEDFFVPWIRDIKSYSVDHISYAWEHPAIDRLMANENFHSPSKAVLNAVNEMAKKGNLYPQDNKLLKERIAKRESLKIENVFVGNGSMEVIDVIARIFIRSGDEAVIPVPTYPVYEKRVQLNGGISVLVQPHEDLSCDVEAVLKSITGKTRLIFIVSPNNPLGTVFPEKDLRRILDAGIPTVVDEAYYELEDTPRSMTFLLKDYANLIVMRTMSKAWGIAGFRIGYSLSSERITECLNAMNVSFTIGTINMAAAIAALEDLEYFKKQNNESKVLRHELEEKLKRIRSLRVFPSSGNFILMDIGKLGITGEEVAEYLLKRDIQVRKQNKPPLGSGFFRVTIGTREQNDRFVHALEEFLSKKNKLNKS